jgi:D-alanyl-D-alanine carboxypeptidase
MSKTYYLFLLLAALVLLPACGRSGDEATSYTTLTGQPELPFASDLQEVLDKGLENYGGVGISAAAIIPGYNPWVGLSGESHPGHPITEEMLFDTGSAGKILMGPLMVKLAEDGLVSLDDPIQEYLPDFPYTEGSITIRQLLNHTSGLYMMVRHPESPFQKPYSEIDHDRWWTIDQIFTELGGDPYFPPGEGWCYSQAGYQISTLIVESVTGETAAQAIQSRLLDPIGIDGMMLDYPNLPQDSALIAHPWVDIDGDGVYEDVQADSRNWIASLSSILFYSSAVDFAAWGHELFTGRVLSEEYKSEMLDFYRMENRCGEPPFFTGYGLGVQEFEPSIFSGTDAWGHLGSIQGYRSILAYLPNVGVTLAVMTNSDSDRALELIDTLVMVLLENLDPKETKIGQIDYLPVRSPPAGAPLFDTFKKEALFCDHNTRWQLEASTEDWINISLEWVVGTDAVIAENAWKNFKHTIRVNGEEIENLRQFTHNIENYSVTCPDETLNIWAKGLSIYLPPLPEGIYDIQWFSEVTGAFNNGWIDYQEGNYMELNAELKVVRE